jgi:hypothetical protein
VARQQRRWAAVLAAAVAAPLAAGAAIDAAVESILVPALEEATGEPVALERVEASLLGSVRLERLAIGDFIAVRALEARASLTSILALAPGADELHIEGPTLRLRRGGARLGALIRRLDARRGARAGSGPRPGWPRLRLSGGSLSLIAGDQRIALEGLSARPTAAGLRIVASRADLDGGAAGHPLRARFRRLAGDVDTSRGRLLRAVASAGEGAWGEARATSISVTYGIPGTFGLRARGEIGGGRFELELHPDRLSAEIDRVAGGSLGPVSDRLGLAGGRISGRARLAGDSLRGRIAIDGARAHIGWLAREPVDVSGELSGEIGVRATAAGLSLEPRPLSFRRGALRAEISGELRWDRERPRKSRGQLSARLAEIECAALLESLPRPFVDNLRGARVAGSLEAAVSARFDLSRPSAEAVELELELDPAACRVRTEPPRLVPALAAAPAIRLAALPDHVPSAFLAAEDARFRDHAGFDRRQIELSLAQNLRSGKLLRGGSTITQQLAKNLFLGHQRTLARKVEEAALAWRLEAHLDKDSILARYLEVIQLGESVHGIEEASRYWFAKTAVELSPREAAFLAALTRSPASSERGIRSGGGIGPALARRIDDILAGMRYLGALSGAELEAARGLELRLAPLTVAAAD